MVHVDDHGRANTARADGDTPRYTPSVHPLPVEIIRVVSLLLLSRQSSKHLDHWTTRAAGRGDTTSKLVTPAISG